MTISTAILLSAIGLIITLLGVSSRLGWHLGRIETTAIAHAASLTSHAERLDNYEDRLVEVVGNVQRLIGRVEATQNRIERQTSARYGEGHSIG